MHCVSHFLARIDNKYLYICYKTVYLYIIRRLSWGSLGSRQVPLAKILGDSTEELAGSIHNDTVTGLLNATFGNAVEMIVAIQSIRSNLLAIVKAT